LPRTLTCAADENTIYEMSYRTPLGRLRTVRFSAEVDGKLSATAARKGKTVSQVIRESVIHDLEEGGQTAADWILHVAKTAAPKRQLDAAFVRRYKRRHS
jgi:predicted DNA-binding protein